MSWDDLEPKTKKPVVLDLGPLSIEDLTLRIADLRSYDSVETRIVGDTISVGVGQRVRLGVELEYSAPWTASSVMLAGVPTWGDRSKNWLELGPVATPVRAGRRLTNASFEAPGRSGHFRLFIVMAAESDAAHIASATNWAAGAPKWFDGNDIAEWGDEQARAARRVGRVAIPGENWDFGGIHTSKGYAVGTAVVEVVVRDAIAGAGSGAGR